MKETQYILFYHQLNYLTYSRNVREIISPNMLAYIGLPQTIPIPYLTTALSKYMDTNCKYKLSRFYDTNIA